MVYVGNKLRQLREHEALTQQELAERAGLTVNAISRIEQEKASARPSTVRKLAEAFGVHPSELTGK
jgi:transcriptional regulator with XRE-family HTH domain